MICCSCVNQGEVKAVEQCGKFSRFAYPGFNCIQCYVGEFVSGTISLRIQQLDVSCETKTKDNVFVTVVVSVQYQVQKENLYDAFYRLTNTRGQITSYVFDVVRSTVPKMNLDDVFTEKEEIADGVKEQLTKSMESFGYSIIKTLVTDIRPDQKVRAAMNEINAASRLRAAALEKAEAQKVQVVKAAEADSEAKYLQGQGVARQRQAIVGGLKESVMGFSGEVEGVNSREVIEMMMITQYFDMLKEIGCQSKTATVFTNHAPSAVSDVGAQLRQGFMEARAAAGSKTD